MSLYCDTDYDEADWYYTPTHDFVTLDTKRRRRCCSCTAVLTPGDDVVRLDRHRGPRHDIEESIYGDEVPMAPWWLCETCGGLHMSLSDLGFCCDISENIADQIREYRAEEDAAAERYRRAAV